MAKDRRERTVTLEEIAKQAGDRERKNAGKMVFGSNGVLSPEEQKGLRSRKGFKPVGESMVNDAASLKQEALIKEYNDKILELDPMYSTTKPIHKFLVRCFHLEMGRSPGGILLPPKVVINVPTQNGIGTLAEIDSPWMLSKKAVVVALDARTRNSDAPILKVGDIIQLGSNPIKGKKAGKDFAITLQAAFMHHTYEDVQPPTDITNPHFGYLLVSLMEIETIV